MSLLVDVQNYGTKYTPNFPLTISAPHPLTDEKGSQSNSIHISIKIDFIRYRAHVTRR